MNRAGSMRRRQLPAVIFGILSSAQWSIAIAEVPLIVKGHTGVVADVQFTPDGNSLISGSWDKTVRLTDCVQGETQAVLYGHADWVEAVALTTDAARIVSASQRDVRTWDIASGSAVSTFTSPGRYSISALALSNDGLRLACGVRDGTVRIWDIGVENPRWTFPTGDAWTRSIAFSADGKFVAAGDWLGMLRVWNLEADGTTAVERDAHAGAPIVSLAFRPTGGQLATGGYDATIKLWDTATWNSTQTLAGHKGLVVSLAYSADSQILASGERHGVIKLWNSSGEAVRTIVAHPDEKLGFSVTGLAFSQDGRRLASCSYDRTIKIWSLD